MSSAKGGNEKKRHVEKQERINIRETAKSPDQGRHVTNFGRKTSRSDSSVMNPVIIPPQVRWGNDAPLGCDWVTHVAKKQAEEKTNISGSFWRRIHKMTSPRTAIISRKKPTSGVALESGFPVPQIVRNGRNISPTLSSVDMRPTRGLIPPVSFI